MAEVAFWRVVSGSQVMGIKFRRQHGVGNFIVDFYAVSLKLAIEVDGRLHQTEQAKKYDARRTAYFRKNGITVLRFTNEDVYHRISEVIERLKSVIGSLQALPLPPGGVRGGSHHPRFKPESSSNSGT
jgi:very-short-patch-repair endonuclease